MALGLALGASACGDDGQSFHDADKRVSELDESGLAQLCEDVTRASASEEVREGLARFVCYSIVQAGGESCSDGRLAQCVQELLSQPADREAGECGLSPATVASCTATVGELEACFDDLWAPVEALAGASCAELASAGNPLGALPASCQRLAQSCPGAMISVGE